MAEHSLLSLRSVTKQFGPTKAVDAATFAVSSGEVVGFLGPNGAGKTTSIRLILGQIKPSSGQIKLFGKGVSPARNDLHRRVGFLGSEMAYEEGLTAGQFLDFAAQIRGGNLQQRIEELAEQLDLKLNHKIRSLSRGNRQKVGLIAAVMHEPALLIMDEPTSGFDPLMQQVFAELIRAHTARGGAALISSHVLSEVQHLCDRAVFISRGRILGQRPIGPLLRESPRLVSLQFASAAAAKQAAERLGRLTGWKSIPAPQPSVDGTYAGAIPVLLSTLAGLKPHQCLIREPELDEVFMQFYGESQSSGVHS